MQGSPRSSGDLTGFRGEGRKTWCAGTKLGCGHDHTEDVDLKPVGKRTDNSSG